MKRPEFLYLWKKFTSKQGESLPSLRSLNIDEVHRIQTEHELWLNSKKKEGKQADFKYCKLPSEARFHHSYNSVCFRGAYLRSIVFDRADLTRADFRDADLRDAKFIDVEGFSSDQLAGSDVSGAKLPPDIQKFEGLEVIREASKNARKLFLAMLLGCVYSIITITTTTDVRLITNSTSSPLPIIGAEIPIVGFYWAAPLLLVCLYIYFHIYMQRIWEGMAGLPAIFPDGISIDLKVYPWLLLGLVRKQYARLRNKRRPLYALQVYLSVFLAWLAMQLTLTLFWLRFIPRHDWLGTGLHIVLIGLAAWLGTMFYHIAIKTLRREGEKVVEANGMRQYHWITGIMRGLLISVALLLISIGAIAGIRPHDKNKGNPKTWVPRVLEKVAFGAFADLEDAEVSTKPPNWTGLKEKEKEELAQVKGVQLDGSNLRYANAKGAFLVKADFSNANLEGAHFTNADLRYATLDTTLLTNADFKSASLVGIMGSNTLLASADLRGADLRGADLDTASLVGAKLLDARLDSAKLIYADLRGANLSTAFLVNADLRYARLNSAILVGADLRGANLSTAFLVNADFPYARLDSARLVGADLRGAELYKASLVGADLHYAHLDSAKLGSADLRGAELYNASLVEAELGYARLDSASLWEADLRYAHLNSAKLVGADLDGADLYYANLDIADLRGANLSHLRNWGDIGSIKLANIWGVRDPPDGFLAWADSMGAVSVETDEEWAALRRLARSSEEP